MSCWNDPYLQTHLYHEFTTWMHKTQVQWIVYYLVTMETVMVWDIQYWAVGELSFLQADVLKARQMGKSEDMSDFDKGQIVMGRPKWQVCCGYYLPKVQVQGRTPLNWWQGHGNPGLVDACGEQRVTCVVPSHISTNCRNSSWCLC